MTHNQTSGRNASSRSRGDEPLDASRLLADGLNNMSRAACHLDITSSSNPLIREMLVAITAFASASTAIGSTRSIRSAARRALSRHLERSGFGNASSRRATGSPIVQAAVLAMITGACLRRPLNRVKNGSRGFNPAVAPLRPAPKRNGAKVVIERTEIKKRSDLPDIERAIGGLQADRASNLNRELKLSTDHASRFFREQWLAMAVAEATGGEDPTSIVAWGQQALPNLDDDEDYGFSLPVMLALQRGTSVFHDGSHRAALDATTIRRHVCERRQGLLGDGGSPRRLVEFDPESPVAPILRRGPRTSETFAAVIRSALQQFEVGAIGRGKFESEHGAKRTLIEFLYELHDNGSEYASGEPGVRMLRLQKHIGSSRDRLAEKAGAFRQLEEYVSRQIGSGAINLVEASVSDFGPGILRSFLASFPGRAHLGRPPIDVLDELLHSQLSGKSDPGAGLGIPNALAAATRMFGFVSLRTGRHWLYLDGSQSERKMRHVPGDHPEVQGTHWQLLYPDMSPVSSANHRRAPL